MCSCSNVLFYCTCSPGINIGTEEMVLGVKTSFWGCVGTGNSRAWPLVLLMHIPLQLCVRCEAQPDSSAWVSHLAIQLEM